MALMRYSSVKSTRRQPSEILHQITQNNSKGVNQVNVINLTFFVSCFRVHRMEIIPWVPEVRVAAFGFESAVL